MWYIVEREREAECFKMGVSIFGSRRSLDGRKKDFQKYNTGYSQPDSSFCRCPQKRLRSR